MNRRDFLKTTSIAALAAAGEWSALSKAFGQDNTQSQGVNRRKRSVQTMEYRNLAGLYVSVLGLGCLPIVGYYGGRYEKKNIIALIRHAYEQGKELRVVLKILILNI